MIVVAGAFSIMVMAQTNPPAGGKQMKHARVRAQSCYIMQNGKVMLNEKGESKPIDAEVTLENGMKIMPDGNITTKEGQKEAMKEGQCYNKKGLDCTQKPGLKKVPSAK